MMMLGGYDVSWGSWSDILCLTCWNKPETRKEYGDQAMDNGDPIQEAELDRNENSEDDEVCCTLCGAKIVVLKEKYEPDPDVGPRS